MPRAVDEVHETSEETMAKQARFTPSLPQLALALACASPPPSRC